MEATLIKTNSKVSMDKSFDYLCSLLRNGVYTVTIKRKTEPRTISQNSLMWLWFSCLEESTGQPKEDWHAYYKTKFLAKEIAVGSRLVTVVGDTKTLNTIQMTNFLNKVQADVAAEFGINLPLPADRFFSAFVDEYKNR